VKEPKFLRSQTISRFKIHVLVSHNQKFNAEHLSICILLSFDTCVCVSTADQQPLFLLLQSQKKQKLQVTL